MKMKIPGWYTTKEICDLFGWSRQMASQTATRLAWERVQVGNSYLYRALDIDEYWCARQRRDLLKKLGRIAGTGLVWHDEYDIDCPECRAFAVEFDGRWECTEGHEGVGLGNE